jgi:cell division protein ZapA (FtsZ GTPase activity inhibitor)
VSKHFKHLQNSVSIKIFGQEYKVKSWGDDDYIQSLSRYIEEMVDDVQKQGNAVTTSDLIAMAMLNMADEVKKTKTELESLKEILNIRVGQLIDRMEKKSK